MKFLGLFIHSPLAAAIGWTLLHSLWEGAILSGILAAGLLLLRTGRARYVLACFAMLALLSAVGCTLIWLVPGSANAVSTVEKPLSSVWNILPGNVASGGEVVGLNAIIPWLAPFWLVGIGLMSARRIIGCLSVRKLRSRGVCCVSDHWQKELERLSSQLRISRPVQLLESCLADIPMVLGHFRPLILLPIGLVAGVSPGQLEAILLHELAHIRRHDYLVNTVQRFVEAMLFYHPAVWWFSSVMRSERENSCDDLVVSIQGNAHEYAVALATLEENRLAMYQSVIAVTGGNLMKRIHRLLYPKTSGPWVPFLAVTILVVTFAGSLAAWNLDPYQAGSAAVPAKNDKTLDPIYTKWLDEDVVYIIDDAERAAFQRLTKDEERSKFVEQFWLRRDATPGTARNEVKEEHYRRIAHANEHFRTTSGAKGWQTDMGHIYIVYGAPDEIESHPKSATAPNAIEVWLYRHIEGIGDNGTIMFVDHSGLGDYRLAPGNFPGAGNTK